MPQINLLNYTQAATIHEDFVLHAESFYNVDCTEICQSSGKFSQNLKISFQVVNAVTGEIPISYSNISVELGTPYTSFTGPDRPVKITIPFKTIANGTYHVRISSSLGDDRSVTAYAYSITKKAKEYTPKQPVTNEIMPIIGVSSGQDGQVVGEEFHFVAGINRSIVDCTGSNCNIDSSNYDDIKIYATVKNATTGKTVYEDDGITPGPHPQFRTSNNAPGIRYVIPFKNFEDGVYNLEMRLKHAGGKVATKQIQGIQKISADKNKANPYISFFNESTNKVVKDNQFFEAAFYNECAEKRCRLDERMDHDEIKAYLEIKNLDTGESKVIVNNLRVGNYAPFSIHGNIARLIFPYSDLGVGSYDMTLVATHDNGSSLTKTAKNLSVEPWAAPDPITPKLNVINGTNGQIIDESFEFKAQLYVQLGCKYCKPNYSHSDLRVDARVVNTQNNTTVFELKNIYPMPG